MLPAGAPSFAPPPAWSTRWSLSTLPLRKVPPPSWDPWDEADDWVDLSVDSMELSWGLGVAFIMTFLEAALFIYSMLLLVFVLVVITQAGLRIPGLRVPGS